jgi:hypothetical protein
MSVVEADERDSDGFPITVDDGDDGWGCWVDDDGVTAVPLSAPTTRVAYFPDDQYDRTTGLLIPLPLDKVVTEEEAEDEQQGPTRRRERPKRVGYSTAPTTHALFGGDGLDNAGHRGPALVGAAGFSHPHHNMATVTAAASAATVCHVPHTTAAAASSGPPVREMLVHVLQSDNSGTVVCIHCLAV